MPVRPHLFSTLFLCTSFSQLSDVLRRFQPGIKQHIHLVVAGSMVSKTKTSTATSSATPASDASGLRHRRGPQVRPSAGTPATPYGTHPSWQWDAQTASDPAVAFAHQQQLHSLSVTAHQCATYAQWCVSMGYPATISQPYFQQAEFYSQWYHYALSQGQMSGVSNSVAPPTEDTHPHAGGPAAEDAHPLPPVDGGEPHLVENAEGAPADADAQFAQAGHAADAGFVDRDEPPPRHELTFGARVLEQVALILKLAFFLMYFGSHVGGWRYGALVLLCVVTLLYQGGWIQRDRAAVAPRPGGRVQDAQPAAPVVVEEGEEEDDEVDGADTVDAAATAPALVREGEVSESDSDAAAIAADVGGADSGEAHVGNPDGESIADSGATPTDAMVAPPVQAPRPIGRVVGNIVYKFFASLVPGMLERQVG